VISLRPGTEADRGYVLGTWLDAYRAAVCPWLPRGELRGALVHRLTKRIAGGLTVACDDLDADRIYGWACGTRGLLHFVYVRDTRRRAGLARRLVLDVCGGVPGACSMLTPSVQMVAARHGVVWRAAR
jgi:GNAT superfamily N-acetyltransferase